MTKSYHQRPSSFPTSPNLEEGRLISTKIVNKESVAKRQPRKNRRQTVKPIPHKTQHYPLWLKIMVIIITVFSFGGLGFGYTLRYAHKWQQLSSPQTSGLPSHDTITSN